MDFNYLYAFIPESFLAISSVLFLFLGLFFKDKKSIFFGLAGKFIVFFTAFLIVMNCKNTNVTNGGFIIDGYFIIKLLGVLAGGVLVGYYLSLRDKDIYSCESIFLVNLCILGMMFSISANDFLSMYVSVELQSLMLYLLVVMDKRGQSGSGSESGLKYFIVGSLGSGIMLYGISIIYGFCGGLSYEVLSNIIYPSHNVGIAPLVGLIFIFVGLFFKLGVVPFHMWIPSVYEGSSKIIMGVLMIIPKITAMVIMMRVWSSLGNDIRDILKEGLILLGILSVITAGLCGIRQQSIKKLLGYSGIAHMGFILMGIAIADINYSSVVTYIVVYVITNLGVLSVVLSYNINNIEDFRGFCNNYKISAFLMSIFLLSMAGIPPLGGFMTKFLVIRDVVSNGHYILALLAIVFSVVSTFYYLRIIKEMYFFKDTNTSIQCNIAYPWTMNVTGIFIAGFVLFFMCFIPYINIWLHI